MGKGLKIVHLNIRSLQKNHEELFLLMGDYDIIMLSETWLNTNCDSNLFNKAGYKLFRQDRDTKIKKKGGGLAFYICDKLVTFTTVIDDVNDVTIYGEQFWISVKAPGRKYMNVGLIYRPPAGRINEFIDQCDEVLTYVTTNLNGELCVAGDFDIDYSKPKLAQCKNLKEIMSRYFLKQIICDFTRITSSSKSMIDLIFTNMSSITESGVLLYNISDHQPIYIIKKKLNVPRKYEYIECRTYKHYSVEALQECIGRDIRWAHFWKENVSVDEMWKIMYEIFLNAVNILCPWVKRKVQIDKPEWLTGEIQNAISEKKNYTVKQNHQTVTKFGKILGKIKGIFRN